MRFIQELIVTSALGFLALELIPLYGDVVSGLFGQVADGLQFALGRV
jgi:hypothetical protein